MSGRYEYPDPTPVALPVGFTPPPTMVELIRMHIRRELSQHAGQQGAETFEEADDFEIEDDPVDPRTPYEAVFDPPVESLPPQGQAVEPAAGSAAAGPSAGPSGSPQPGSSAAAGGVVQTPTAST